jgi:hypothetical protein
MEKYEVNIIGLSESESQKGYYVLVMEEKKTKKRIPIIIGQAEAQSIAIFMEKLLPVRPLSHDFFKNILISLNATVTEVYIHKILKNTFYASLFIKDFNNQIHEIDARPSDAILMALRFSKPIFINKEIFETSAFDVDEKGREKKGSYAEFTLKQLEELLDKLIKKEDYESAVRVREAIERRKN